MVSSELLLRVSSSSVRIAKRKRGAAISADIQAEDAQDHARSYHSAAQPHDVEHSRKEHRAGTDTSLPPFRQGFSISTSCAGAARLPRPCVRSEEHTSELQSLMRISYAVFCLKKKKNTKH